MIGRLRYRLRTVLVYYDGTDGSDHLLALASAATDRPGHIIALIVTRVPPALPLRADVPSLREKALRRLVRARALADAKGIDVELEIIRGRDVAQVIAGRAREINADAIFMTAKRPRIPWLARWLPGLVGGVMRQASNPLYLLYDDETPSEEDEGTFSEPEEVAPVIRLRRTRSLRE